MPRSQAATPRIAFAGDREIAVNILQFLLSAGTEPLALMLPEKNASHADTLRALCSKVPPDRIWELTTLKNNQTVFDQLRELDLDYIICIHFPLIVPKPVLDLPRHGVLNLHPAYLPYNRGWHNSIWPILEKTPAGATLHFMDQGIDTGDIVAQRRIEVQPDDTGNSLYRRVLSAEHEVFRQAWPSLATFSYKRHPQPQTGSSHRKADLTRDIQFVDLDRPVEQARQLIDLLRAFTTNQLSEAAFFCEKGKTYRIQISINEVPD